MSLAALRSEVAACRAWERALHAGSPETRKAAALPNLTELWLPLLMPLYGIIGFGAGVRFESEWWTAILPWWWLLSFGRLFPRTLPSEWEVLRLPSRRGWLLARWSLRLPGLTFLGLCTIAHHLLLALRDVPHPESLRWTLVAALLLAPLLFEALAAWFPIQERAFGGKSWLAPMLALALALILLGLAVVVLVTVEAQPGEAPVVSGALAALALIIFALVFPSLEELRKGAARLSGGFGLSVMSREGLVGMAGVVPAMIIGIGVLMAPSTLVVEHGDRPLAALGPILLALVVGGIALVATDAVRLLEIMDVGIEPRPEVKPSRGTIVAPSRPVAGGGLRAAAWTLYRGRWRTLQHPWLTFLPKLLWECRAPVCGAIASLAFTAGASAGGYRVLLALWVGGIFLFVLPRHLHVPPSRRLHFLGVDYGALVLHNLRWGLLLEALPGMLGAATVLLLPLEKWNPWAAWGAVLAASSVLVLRQGTAFHLLFDFGWWAGRWCLLAFLSGLVAGFLLDAPRTLFSAGIVLTIVAAGTTAWDLHDPGAAGLRVEQDAADD